MNGLGVGYEHLHKVNPRLIYATNSGFGPKGSWSERGSFDIVAQGMSGSMISQGGETRGREPVHIGWGLADQVGSMVFAYGIMTALLARERHGVGQRVDVSQLGAMMTLQALGLTGFLHTGTQLVRTGRANNPTFTYYQASDGEWLTVGVLTAKHWPLLCKALEREDLLTDERSAEPFARAENREWDDGGARGHHRQAHAPALARRLRGERRTVRPGVRLRWRRGGSAILGQRTTS